MNAIHAAALAAFAAAAAALAPAASPAQEVAPGLQVERVTLRPGESASFTLAPGFHHQLLKRAAPSDPGAITIRYEAGGGGSTITATSRAGHPLAFTILADPDGNGGFASMGEMSVSGDGTPATRSWPNPLGTINVGDFVGGPHGTHDHQPSGD
ncbi:MAG TPA: hypothetical protein VGW34_13055 [Allosphingosinicella sp.]|nr:hypothetical protein [Allosphingosinicella sp.]